jgi:hypothetical protein
MRGQAHVEWWTTDRGGWLGKAAVVIVAMALLGGGGAAAVAAAVASAVLMLFWAAAGGLVLLGAGLAWFIVHRRRHPETRLIPRPQFHGFDQPPSVAAPKRPQITNVFIGGNHVHAPGTVPVRGEIQGP